MQCPSKITLGDSFICLGVIYYCMKVVYFERKARSPIHIHAGRYANAFYVPDEDVLLFSEQHGTFGGRDFSLTTNERPLDEARAIARGEIPSLDGVTYSNIRKFDYDESRLRDLIQDARLKAELEPRVKSGIEKLLKYAGRKRRR